MNYKFILIYLATQSAQGNPLKISEEPAPISKDLCIPGEEMVDYS